MGTACQRKGGHPAADSQSAPLQTQPWQSGDRRPPGSCLLKGGSAPQKRAFQSWVQGPGKSAEDGVSQGFGSEGDALKSQGLLVHPPCSCLDVWAGPHDFIAGKRPIQATAGEERDKRVAGKGCLPSTHNKVRHGGRHDSSGVSVDSLERAPQRAARRVPIPKRQ